jgi:RHS repeat-associated protein
MAGTAVVQIAYGQIVTNILMTGGVIQGPNGSGEYSVQSFACVQWGFDLPVEPKPDQPVSIQYFFIDDNENPGYTEFEALDELNPVIYWSRPSSHCLKVYFDESDGNWVLEPLVFLSYSTAPARLKGVLVTDDSNAGDSGGPRSGVKRPVPDSSELTNAPPIGDLSADCPGQGGGFALSVESVNSPTITKRKRASEARAPKGMQFKPARWELNGQNVTTSEAKEPKVKLPTQDRQVATTLGSSGTLSLLSANGYSVAKPIGQLLWEMSLGSVARTLRLGRLSYQAETLDSTAYSRGRLSLASGGDPNMVINDSSGFLRQVELPENLIDIVSITNAAGITNGFQVGVYSKAQVGPFDPMTGLFPTNGSLPLLTWKVENPDATPLGRVRFTKTEGTNSEVHLAEWSGTAQVSGTMTITRHGGKWKDVTEYSLASTNQRIETLSLYKGTNLQHKVRQVYQEFYNWGAPGDIYDAVVERVEDPDGQALTSTFVYWDQTSQPGNLLYSATYPDGYAELVPNRISGDGYAPVVSSGSPVRVDQPYRDFAAGSASGRKTQTFFEEVSGLELWVIQETTVAGQLVGRRETLNDFTIPGYWATATYDLAGDGSHAYEERIVSLEHRRTVLSRDRQGNIQNYLYTPGYWDAATATFSQGPSSGAVSALKTTIVNGVVGADQGISNKTTVDVTIEDGVGRLLAQESYISAGDWENTTALIDRTIHTYVNGRRVASKRNGRLTYQASYFGDGLLEWEEDEMGRRTEYTYDEMDRVLQKIIRGRGGDADQALTYDYDVLGRVIREVRSAGGLTVETRSIYNLAGELVATIAVDGLTNTVTTSYASGFRVVTETLPTLGTRVTSFFKDRQVRSITGTAVEDEYYLPFLALWAAPSSYREAVTIYRDSELTQFRETRVRDWLGAGILLQTPRFQAAGTRNRYTFYDVAVDGSSRGLVTEITETGRATQLFNYDARGQLTAHGLDLNTNGILDAASTDVITLSDHSFSDMAGVWHEAVTIHRYLQDNIASSNLLQTTRTPVPASLATNVVTSNVVERAGGGLTVSSITLNRTTGDLTSTVNDQELGHVRTSVERDGLLRSETSPGVTTPKTYIYTALNEVDTVSDPLTGTTTNTYDVITRRLLSVSDALERTTTYEYYSAGITNAGQIKGVRDANLNWTYFDYTGAGQVFRRWGANAYPVEYRYDEAGRMTEIKTFRTLPGAVNWAQPFWPNPSGGDTTTWVYDAPSGLLERKIYADGGTGAKTAIYTYDSGNFVDTRTNGRGQASDYTYDTIGRLTAITYTDGTPPVTLEYDRGGRPRSVVDGSGLRSWTWTERDQMDDETYTGGLLSGMSLNRSYDSQFRLQRLELKRSGVTATRQRFAYDSISRLDYMVEETPDGTAVLRNFDYTFKPGTPFVESVAFSHGSNVVMTQTYDRDFLGRLAGAGATLTAGATVNAVNYQFDSLNRRFEGNLGDGSIWNYAYNARSEVTAGKKRLPSNAFGGGQQFEYNYDDIGNRSVARFGGDSAGASLRDANYNAANALNQSTTRTTPGSIWLIGDAETNLVLHGAIDGRAFPVQRQEGGRFYAEANVDNSHDPAFPRLAVAGKSGTNLTDVEIGHRYVPMNPEVFIHDADGNLASDGRWTNRWDCESRLLSTESLASVPEAARKRLEFAYDFQGRRFSKRVYHWDAAMSSYVLATEIRFIYNGWNLVAELNSTNGISRSCVWGLDLGGNFHGAGGVGGLLGMTISSGEHPGSYAYTYDGNGNVMGMVNFSNAVISAEYEYGPFGEIIRATGPLGPVNTFRFSTKYQDDETGLLYYGYRYYAASSGRWLSRDRLGENAGINLYGFLANSAPNHVDALGLKSHENPNWYTREEAIERWGPVAGFGNPPPMPGIDNTGPYQLGWEWLTGNGPARRYFGPGSMLIPFLQQHQHVVDVRQELINQISRYCACESDKTILHWDYSVGGVDGIFLYLKDYSELVKDGLQRAIDRDRAVEGNVVVAFLGSFGAKGYLSDIECMKDGGGTATARFQLWNTSSIQSATHPPLLGYFDFWQKYIEPIIGDIHEEIFPVNPVTGRRPGGNTRQDFIWDERLQSE